MSNSSSLNLLHNAIPLVSGKLTSKEFSLLECLMRNAGNIVTRVILLERVWEYNYTPFTNALDVYINHLRNKIDKDYELKLIHTYRGRGYTIKA